MHPSQHVWRFTPHWKACNGWQCCCMSQASKEHKVADGSSQEVPQNMLLQTLTGQMSRSAQGMPSGPQCFDSLLTSKECQCKNGTRQAHTYSKPHCTDLQLDTAMFCVCSSSSSFAQHTHLEEAFGQALDVRPGRAAAGQPLCVRLLAAHTAQLSCCSLRLFSFARFLFGQWCCFC